MAKIVKIAETKDLMPGQGGVFDVEGEKIVVFNVDGHFYAIEDRFNREDGPCATLPGPAKYYNVKASGTEIQLVL